jgi:iron(III) transport system substrate-binding protein
MARWGMLLLVLLLVAAPVHAKDTVVIYTAIEPEQITDYMKAVNKTLPNIEVKMLRLSTGDISARFMAEKDNMQADVIWGVAATNVMVFKNAGLLEPYAPKGLERVQPLFRDKDATPSWVGIDIYMSAFCFNTEVAKKKNLPKPESWADLTKPVYKGQITMPNPASSGTGYFDVSAWLQTMGEQGGWKYMDALHENIAQYTHSGSKPCRQAGAGEFVVGISFDFRGNDVKQKGAPVELVFPKEGLGWDIEASAIMKNTKKMDAAKKLMDWVATKEANEAYSKNFAIVAHPAVKPALAHIPADLETRLIKNDFAFAATNRDRILAEWQKRYAVKTEK